LEETNKKDGKVTTIMRTVYSRDGKSRTATTTGVNAQGQKVNNVERFQQGRSRTWYWRQALFAITTQRLNQVRRIAGGYRRRRSIVSVGAALVGLFLFMMQAQAQLTIHAASDQPVPGWDRMEYNKLAVWVSPTVSLTSADILWAESSTRPDGARSVGVLFTDAGAKKMTELSHAQLNKLIAMVLDGKVIFAPKVRAKIGAQALITGKDPSGLPAEVAQRIVDSVKKK
jgi:hypothetical protein